MNKAILVGNLTRDPEKRTTPQGTSVTSFTVAVQKRFKNQDGRYDADFINCVAWRQTADFVAQYFSKGSRIGVVGSIQTRSYDDKDGNKRYVTEVVVEGISFTGERRDDSSSNVPVSEQSNGYSAVPANEQEYTEMPVDDDLPF